MTGNPASVSVLALAGCLICFGILTATGPVRAQLPHAPSLDPQPAIPTPRQDEQALDFNLPALPLAAALNLYSATAKLPALYDSDLVAGRVSTAVRGRYSAEAALGVLLEGTGLVAEKIDSDLGQTFVLKESDTAAAVARTGLAELLGADGYAGRVQARIAQALCTDPRTMPGQYSSVLRFRVDAAGRIYDARQIGSSGDAGRDAALLQILRRVRIDLLPPPAVAQQPLTMMILPAHGGARSDAAPPCPANDGKDAS